MIYNAWLNGRFLNIQIILMVIIQKSEGTRTKIVNTSWNVSPHCTNFPLNQSVRDVDFYACVTIPPGDMSGLVNDQREKYIFFFSQRTRQSEFLKGPIIIQSTSKDRQIIFHGGFLTPNWVSFSLIGIKVNF